MIKHGKDIDGDRTMAVAVGDMTAFATQQIDGSWSLNFALTAEMDGGDWMDTMTGRGAFSTIRALRPALSTLIAEIERMGREWSICCDARRARLYGRYVPAAKICVTE
jgi:hypothetical protein